MSLFCDVWSWIQVQESDASKCRGWRDLLRKTEYDNTIDPSSARIVWNEDLMQNNKLSIFSFRFYSKMLTTFYMNEILFKLSQYDLPNWSFLVILVDIAGKSSVMILLGLFPKNSSWCWGNTVTSLGNV